MPYVKAGRGRRQGVVARAQNGFDHESMDAEEFDEPAVAKNPDVLPSFEPSGVAL